MKYLAAAVQFEPVMFDKARNVEVLASMVEKAAAAGARLIVTPEIFFQMHIRKKRVCRDLVVYLVRILFIFPVKRSFFRALSAAFL